MSYREGNRKENMAGVKSMGMNYKDTDCISMMVWYVVNANKLPFWALY